MMELHYFFFKGELLSTADGQKVLFKHEIQ